MIDISNDMYIIRAAIVEAAAFISAPHVRLRPSIFPDGNQWCCLLGDNLQVGIVGFGETPEKACAAFDNAFATQQPALVVRNRKDCERYDRCEEGIAECHCLDEQVSA